MELTEQELQEKINAAINTAVQGLKDKNQELLAKINKANEKAEAEAEAKRLAEEKAEQDRLTAEGKHSEVLERVRANHDAELKTLRERAEKAEKALQKSDATLRKIMVDNEIDKRLIAAGVTDAVLLEAASAMITPTADIVEGQDESGKEILTVKIGTQNLDDYFSAWKEGKGKSFITNGNSGGGSGGSRSGGNADEWEAHFKPESANQTKQNELRISNPELYDSLRKKYPLQTSTPILGVN